MFGKAEFTPPYDKWDSKRMLFFLGCEECGIWGHLLMFPNLREIQVPDRGLWGNIRPAGHVCFVSFLVDYVVM